MTDQPVLNRQQLLESARFSNRVWQDALASEEVYKETFLNTVRLIAAKAIAAAIAHPGITPEDVTNYTLLSATAQLTLMEWFSEQLDTEIMDTTTGITEAAIDADTERYADIAEAVQSTYDIITKQYPAATITALYYDIPEPVSGTVESGALRALFKTVAENREVVARLYRRSTPVSEPNWCWLIKQAETDWWFEYVGKGQVGTAGGWHSIAIGGDK